MRPVKRNDKGLLFDEIDKDASTKDKQVITDKLHMLENLMLDFLHIDNTNFVQINIESFIARNLDIDVETVQDDMDFYNESLNELLDHTVKIDSKLRNEENRFSLLAMMVYSYKEDKDLDEWMTEYARRNNTYFIDQKKNFLHMKNDFEKYLKRCA